MSFSTLGLSKPLLKAIADEGYTTPTPIQKQAIPIILSKKDVLAGAQTGTGKTAGFTLPLLQILSEQQNKSSKIKALILTPTRELASQVDESVTTYGKYLPFKSTVIFGGVGINPQISKLKKGVDIVVATPGRLLDHVGQKTIDLSHVEFLILDEADRMLDMGFIHDIKKILNILPKKRQNLLFSATFSDEIKKLADGLLNNPSLIEVARRNTTSEQITQTIHPVDREKKKDLLTNLIQTNNWQQVLVFTRTKHGANKLSQHLESNEITSAAIHGNKSQGARTKALADFKNGEVRVLVATDIAARGIDIDLLPHVVNFELPNVPEDYVHRIGRTGRAGSNGEAISLVCIDEDELLRNIEKLIKNKIPKVIIDDFKPNPNIKAEPIQKQRGQNRGQNQRTDSNRGESSRGRERSNSSNRYGNSDGKSNGNTRGQQRRRTSSSSRSHSN